jgi:hypothetical protein
MPAEPLGRAAAARHDRTERAATEALHAARVRRRTPSRLDPAAPLRPQHHSLGTTALPRVAVTAKRRGRELPLGRLAFALDRTAAPARAIGFLLQVRRPGDPKLLWLVDRLEVSGVQLLSDGRRPSGRLGAEVVMPQFGHEAFPQLGPAALEHLGPCS